MTCPKCNSEGTHKNGSRGGKQQYRCTSCGHYFYEVAKCTTPSPSKKNGESNHQVPAGLSISEFRETNDVSARVDKVLRTLRRDRLYTLDDVLGATGFRRGFPMLRTTIDAHKEYFGKGVADGILYFGHPETISELKGQRTMS